MASLTANAPDPKGFKKWEDAFQYPVPAVRRMEQQLRNDIASNRERLRTLVGSSYRELLGTAESIIQMDQQIETVEASLGGMSARCNSRLLERSGANMRKLLKHNADADRQRYENASLSFVFGRCPGVLTRLLRGGSSLLLASQVLILARLLHRRLSKGQNVPANLEKMWHRIGKLRQRTLMLIDRRLGRTGAAAKDYVDAMCAHALATGSSTADTLTHFLDVRLNAIVASWDTPGSAGNSGSSSSQEHTIALSSFVQTLHDVRAIFPRQLSTALAKLGREAVAKNEAVLAIADLEVDVHGQWLGEEIQNFTPFIRHDDLDTRTAAEQLRKWAPSAWQKLLDGLRQRLATMESFEAVIGIRRESLKLWFSRSHAVTSVNRREIVESLRTAFRDRLTALIEHRCDSVKEVERSIGECLQELSQPQDTDGKHSLWDPSIVNLDVSRRTAAFIETIQQTHYGRTGQVTKTVDTYRKWLQSTKDAGKQIEKLRQDGWESDDEDDDYDDDDDDDDEDAENEDRATPRPFTSRRKVLSEDEPSTLAQGLAAALDASLRHLERVMNTASAGLAAETSRAEAPAKAAYLLRVMREVRQRPPPQANLQHPGQFGASSIRDLHRIIAQPVVQVVIDGQIKAINRAIQVQSPASRALWEGEPPLPTIPSPWTYRLLRRFEMELARCGTDLWTSAALEELRAAFREGLGRGLTGLDSDSGALSNGHDSTGPEASDIKAGEGHNNGDTDDPAGAAETVSSLAKPEILDGRDGKVQLLFDMEYLNAATLGDQTTDAKSDVLRQRQDDVQSSTRLESRELEWLRKSALEYWKRTHLLFGLLG